MSQQLDKPEKPSPAQLVSGAYPSVGAPTHWRQHPWRAFRNFCRRVWRGFIIFCRLHPVLALFLVTVGFNLMHSAFNIGYNLQLIRDRHMDDSQRKVFEVVLTYYNIVVYPICVGFFLWSLRPIWRVHPRLLAGREILPAEQSAAQKRLVDVPFIFVCVNSIGWLPGAVIFPLMICWFGSMHDAAAIWIHFFLSFVVSALITIMQIFFILEGILIRALYPLYFQNARPADVKGVMPRISFFWRVTMFYAAVGLMPMVAMMLVAWNFADDKPDQQQFVVTVFVVGVVSAALISLSMGTGLFRWLMAHRLGTEELAQGNFQYRIQEKRPDEWGKLTDHFNDMAQALEDAEYMRQTFGQVKHPAVRDAIIKRYPGIGGEVCEITVMFSDIRGFTRRSAGQPPEKVFQLLNRFLTLSVRAVEMKGGIVDKFLGDGIMALFNAPFKPLPHHADQAVSAALEMLKRLEQLNEELGRQGEAPLTIGIGIHTGPALVGCPGATLEAGDGKTDIRRDFTAIGETVNLSQRMEQFTKTLGGPILVSEQTRRHLKQDLPLECLGEHDVPGYGGTLTVYKVVRDGACT